MKGPEFKSRQGSGYGVATSARSLFQRFAYMGLIVLAVAILMIGKADEVLVERVRAQVADVASPILSFLSRPSVTVSDWVAQGKEMLSLRAENVRLRAENARLMQWQAVARQMEVENRELRSIAGYVPDGNIGYATGRVIADTGGTFAHSLLLNAGLRDGVAKGQAVIADDGLVGRIAEAGQRTSRVLLITDLNSRIPVVVESSRARAVLAGSNDSQPRLIHLIRGASIAPGDRISTSGHGGAFPPGLPVGIVTAVSEDGIVVQPFINRDRLEYVRAINFGLSGILQRGIEIQSRVTAAPAGATVEPKAADADGSNSDADPKKSRPSTPQPKTGADRSTSR